MKKTIFLTILSFHDCVCNAWSLGSRLLRETLTSPHSCHRGPCLCKLLAEKPAFMLPTRYFFCGFLQPSLEGRVRNKDAWWKTDFVPIPLFLLFFKYKTVKGPLESIDLANAVILVFVFFWKHPFVAAKLAGMLVFLIFQSFFVKMGVKSYPFEESMVNLASWTP